MMTFILSAKRPRDTQVSRDVASWLGLAASPVFALMAGNSAHDVQVMICASEPAILPIGGMAIMYLLMSLFHLPPWLRLASAYARTRAQPTPQTRGD